MYCKMLFVIMAKVHKILYFCKRLYNFASDNKKIGMYYIKKRIEVSGSHHLTLDYESKCAGLHGHNWYITVFCKNDVLNSNGMVVDFADIKRLVKDKMDHKNLNEMFDFNPTAENIARWICDNVPYCYRVEVEENFGNTAIYEKD